MSALITTGGATAEWIDWVGGKCPVDDQDVEVVARLRDGSVVMHAARWLDWTHGGDLQGQDIVQWRIRTDADRRPPGRPPLPPSRRRTERLSVRTYADVVEIAKRRGTAWLEAVLRAGDAAQVARDGDAGDTPPPPGRSVRS